jgi:hypothetical protein
MAASVSSPSHPPFRVEEFGVATGGGIWVATGDRGTLEQMDADAREHVRLANRNYVRTSRISSVEANVIYAIATKA